MSLFELGLRNTALSLERITGLGPLQANETPEGYNARIGYVADNAQLLAGSGPGAIAGFSFVVDGEQLGLQGYLPVPFACSLLEWTLVADITGSLVVDVLHSTFAAFPPVTSIVGAAPPNINNSNKGRSAVLTGWTPAIGAGDILGISVVSATDIVLATLTLKVILT